MVPPPSAYPTGGARGLIAGYVGGMHTVANDRRIRDLMRELGERARLPARVYFVGGATAVLEGWRAATIDVDLRFVPENRDLFEALPRLKESLDLNIELAWPSQFLPELPGWEDRSPWIASFGRLQFHHYDPYSQLFAKIERDHDRDRIDVAALLASEWIDRERAWELFLSIEPELIRYPAVDAAVVRRKIEVSLGR
jgi:hypothetical protein